MDKVIHEMKNKQPVSFTDTGESEREPEKKNLRVSFRSAPKFEKNRHSTITVYPGEEDQENRENVCCRHRSCCIFLIIIILCALIGVLVWRFRYHNATEDHREVCTFECNKCHENPTLQSNLCETKPKGPAPNCEHCVSKPYSPSHGHYTICEFINNAHDVKIHGRECKGSDCGESTFSWIFYCDMNE